MVAVAQTLAATPGAVSAAKGQPAASVDVELIQARLTTALLNALSAQPAGVIATVIATPQPDKALLNLAGQVVEATIAKGSLPAAALQPGAQLQLTANAAPAGQTPALKFVSYQPATAPSDPAATRSTPAAGTPNVTVVAAASPIDSSKPKLLANPALALATSTPTAAPLKALVAEALPRQTGPGALLTTLQTALADTDAPLPPRVATLASALLGLSLDLDAPVTGARVKEAAANWAGPQPATISLPEQKQALPPAQLLLRLLAVTAQSSALPEQTLPDQSLPRSVAPPPPLREADPVLHPRAVISETAVKLSPEQRLATIAAEAERSDDRLLLHHAAPIPNDVMRPQTDLPRQLVQSFDLPVMLAGQPMISPFRVERDAPERGQARGEEPAWSIRFAIDMPVLGPVHAHLRLQPLGAQAPRLSMTLWAEQTESRDILTSLRDTLEADLSDSGFDAGDLTILPGRPAPMPQHTKPGQMLDKKS